MSPTDQNYQQHLNEYYDKQSAVYSATYTGEGRYPTGHHRLQITLKMVEEMETKPQTIIDAGCGDARMVIELQKRGLNCTGFDPSEGMLEVGRALLKENGMSEDLISQGDIYNIPAEDNSVDLVLALGVLENLDKHEEIFAECRRVLKPNGRVLFSVDNHLFSLFTFNKHTVHFYKEFFKDINVPDDVRNEVLTNIAKWMNIDDVQEIERIIGDHQIEKSEVAIPEYNRLNVDDEMRKMGFATERLRFYHVHPIPPRFEGEHPDLFKDFAEKLETSEYDWHSTLMCNCMLVQVFPI